MRVVVTRPQIDAERTASALRSRGHEVLVAPLMRVEPIAADLGGQWGAVIITSANAPAAIVGHPSRDTLVNLPLYAVGHRSADAAKAAGFADVHSAAGDVRDLVRLLAGRHIDGKAPLLYLAGEDRAADLIGELSARGITAEMRVVYRAMTAPFPDELIEALKAGEVDAVLHFSRRSAENYLSGASRAGISAEALRPRHICLSELIAAPLVVAGATAIAISPQPQEAALIELLVPPRG